jgi:formylglycine-generating enzyme
MKFVATGRGGVCVDEFELTNVQDRLDLPYSYPLSDQNYYQCKARCRSVGKRLLTHPEWVAACGKTVKETCNIYQPHPIIRRLEDPLPWIYQGHDCRKGSNAWGVCMKDPVLLKGLARNDEFSRCTSQHGIRHIVGNLGEWVEPMPGYTGQFDGGLYPQPKSSCQYRTVAHGPRYHDYSIGCRCGANPQDGWWGLDSVE